MKTSERSKLSLRAGHLWLWGLLAVANAVWLLWMTLRPQASVQRELAPIVEGATASGISAQFLIGTLGNVVVFAPLGAAVFQLLWRRSRWGAVIWGTAAGAGLSAVIEGLQGLSASRFSDGSDWLLNTLGALLGALGMLSLHWVFCRGRAKGGVDGQL